MTDPAVLAELWRGDRVESRHRGHVAIVDGAGDIRFSLGDPAAVIYPRSSCKMIQALPLIESGAAAAAGLGPEHLALACASHIGAAMHVTRVAAWLESLDLGEADLRCGPQVPEDKDERHRLRGAGEAPCQLHNNCSGKHSGFLTLGRHLRAGPDYVDPSHPVQSAVREAFEAMTGETSPGWGIDGCSAPNFACTLAGLARAAAGMADPDTLGATRSGAARMLVEAMSTYPELIDGPGKASTELTAASRGAAVVKTGAEGVYVGILPEAGLGIALKVEDGATRASEAAMAALLVRMGILEAGDPVVQRRTRAEERNRRDLLAGHLVAAPALFAG